MRSAFSNAMISATLTVLLILNGNMWWDYPPKSVNFGFRPLCGFDGDSLLFQKIPPLINGRILRLGIGSTGQNGPRMNIFHYHGPFSSAERNQISLTLPPTLPTRFHALIANEHHRAQQRRAFQKKSTEKLCFR